LDKIPIRLGLRENLGQFSLLVVVNAFVGAMVGMERSILPAIAVQVFHLAAKVAILSFIVVFGITKALTNYLAGRLADRFGRKHVLVAGWLVAIPVPFMLMWAPSWDWIVAANVLLGVSQGLTWSTTVIMKIDLVGPQAAWTCDGAQRVRRLRGASRKCACNRMASRALWTSA
jgi:MFS family permease